MNAAAKLDPKRIRDLIRQPHDALFRMLISDPERVDALIRDHAPDSLRYRMEGVQARPGIAAAVSPLLEQTFPDGEVEFGGRAGRPDLAVACEYKRDPKWHVIDQLAVDAAGIRQRYREAGVRPKLVQTLFTTGPAPVRAPWAAGRMQGGLSLLNADPILLLCYWLAVAETRYEELSHRPDVRGVPGALRCALVAPAPVETPEKVFRDLSCLPRNAPLWGMTYIYGLHVFVLERDELDPLIRAVDPKRTLAEMPTMFPQMMQERDALSRAEGRAEGRVEGRADLRLRQMRLRFGPNSAEIEARIQAASAADVEAWGEHIFEARSLDDLFWKRCLN